MSDFDDLRQIREAKENTEALARQKKLGEEKQQVEAAQYLEDRKRTAANKLNDTVTEVLEVLRDAIYPGYEVEQSFGWKIGWEIGFLEADGAKEIFCPQVTVELEFDKGGEPRRFCIHRGQRYYSNYESAMCGLSRKELVHSLRKLHPPRIVNEIPAH